VNIVLAIFLALTVAAAWLGAIGLLRFRTALARLHCATFVTVAGGLTLTTSVFVSDGASSRAWKSLGLMLMLLIIGAAASHALGRALITRQEAEK
jgi:monovalent cation/proton antiporter MnhG/PhaG subunit